VTNLAELLQIHQFFILKVWRAVSNTSEHVVSGAGEHLLRNVAKAAR
jgi:hypothetical protein